MGYAIGIDLGTTNTCVAVLRNGEIQIIKNEMGNNITPSYVAFNELERIIGDMAKTNAHSNNTDTIYDVKRFIGRPFFDPIVQSDRNNWPFNLIDIADRPYIEIGIKNKEQLFTAEEISAMILRKMKELAERYLNETVTNAVITVPAYFNHLQRRATYDAAKIAGLNVLKLINEPTAAAIAYGYKNFQFIQANTNLVVVDLGGGTFDVSVLTIGEEKMQILASNGDTHLGGEDFNKNLVEYCIQEFKNVCKENIRKNQRAMNRLRAACDTAKKELSTAIETEIAIDGLCEGIDFHTSVTRARFENMNNKEFKKILGPIRRALQDAKLSKDQITKVILVGGSTRIPSIQKIVADYFNGQEIDTTIDADQAVAFGAAVHAAILNDDAAQIGNAFQHVLKDITPLSLGYGAEKDCKYMKFVVQRNTVVPTEVVNECTTIHNNQEFILFRIHQGENNLADKNFLLGEFQLQKIPIGPKGSVKVDVIFAIDANGILHVSARDRSTGNSNGITIKDVSGSLSNKQIKEMIAKAQKYRDNEMERKSAMLARTLLEYKLVELKEKWVNGENKLMVIQKKHLSNKYEEATNWIKKNPRENRQLYEDKLKHIVQITDSFVGKKYDRGRESRRLTFAGI